jgi:hypothetical protein
LSYDQFFKISVSFCPYKSAVIFSFTTVVFAANGRVGCDCCGALAINLIRDQVIIEDFVAHVWPVLYKIKLSLA